MRERLQVSAWLDPMLQWLDVLLDPLLMGFLLFVDTPMAPSRATRVLAGLTEPGSVATPLQMLVKMPL